MQNLNGKKQYGCDPIYNPRVEQYFYKTSLAQNINDPSKLYLRINGKMREIDEKTRQGILKYDLLTSHANDKTSGDDIIKLSCGELAAIPYGEPIKSATLAKGPNCQNYEIHSNHGCNPVYPMGCC